LVKNVEVKNHFQKGKKGPGKKKQTEMGETATQICATHGKKEANKRAREEAPSGGATFV